MIKGVAAYGDKGGAIQVTEVELIIIAKKKPVITRTIE